jgi:hypothetical protein
MTKLRKIIMLIISSCVLLHLKPFAQTATEISDAKKSFEGNWVNKKTGRHLSISFEYNEYVLINDWHGKFNSNNNSIDAYKAFIESGKLVMPEDKTDLRSPYCEILRKENHLLYRCKGDGPTANEFMEQIIFVREK